MNFIISFLQKLGLATFFCILYLVAFGQKKPKIDNTVYSKWPSVQSPSISNDGKYVIYTIDNQPVNQKTLVVVSTNGDWRRKIIGVDFGEFLSDNKRMIYASKDGLNILHLGGNYLETLEGASSHRLGKNQLFYLQNRELKIRNLFTKADKIYKGVDSYSVSPDEKSVIIQTKIGDDCHMLTWVSLITGLSKKIFDGRVVSSLTFDQQGEQLAFITRGKNQSLDKKTICIYNSIKDTAFLYADENFPEIDSNLKIQGILKFSND